MKRRRGRGGTRKRAGESGTRPLEGGDGCTEVRVEERDRERLLHTSDLIGAFWAVQSRL